MSYTPEQKDVLELGLAGQHRHDACAHMVFAGRSDTFMRVTSERKHIRAIR